VSATVSGVLSTPSGAQNLTSLGTIDSTHWGSTTATSSKHKAGITAQISNYSVIGSTAAIRYTDHPFGFTWTGGKPTAAAMATTTGCKSKG
jgi:hypothetical protein